MKYWYINQLEINTIFVKNKNYVNTKRATHGRLKGLH